MSDSSAAEEKLAVRLVLVVRIAAAMKLIASFFLLLLFVFFCFCFCFFISGICLLSFILT